MKEFEYEAACAKLDEFTEYFLDREKRLKNGCIRPYEECKPLNCFECFAKKMKEILKEGLEDD